MGETPGCKNCRVPSVRRCVNCGRSIGATYDPSRERLVPLDAVVLERDHAREILVELEDVLQGLREKVRVYDKYPTLGPRARAELEDAETMVARLRSALDGEG